MFFRILIAFFLWLILLPAANGFGSDIRNQCEDYIAEVMGPGTRTQFTKIVIPEDIRRSIEIKCGQMFSAPHIYMWQIFNSDSLCGYALLDNVQGKLLPITFIVIFNRTNTVTGCSVIKYRENHGREVTGRSWLDQFRGKNSNAPMQVGNDIDAISGATISANSVANGVRKLSLFLKEYIDKNFATVPELMGENAK